MDFGIYAADVNKTIYVRLRDSTTGLAKTGLAFGSAGAVCSYVLPGAARAAITLATQTVTGGHSDGGFVEVDATNCKGLYRLDLTDAAIASGDYTLISIEFDGIIEETMSIPLHIRNVNLETIKTQAVTCAAGVTVNPSVGAATIQPTVTEFNARSLASADYTIVSDLGTVQTGDSFALIGTAGAGLTNLGASANDWNTVVPDAAGVAPTTAEIATGVWTDTTAGDFTTALSVGKSVMNGVTLGTGLTTVSVSGAVGSVTATVTADVDTIKTQVVTCSAGVTVNPSVGAATIQPTVTQFDARTLVAASYFDPAADTVATVTTLTNLPAVTAGWLTAAGIATDAIGAAELAADAVTEIQAGLATPTNITAATGVSLSTAGILAIWHQALTAVVTAGSVGKLLKDEITSVRMATLTDWIDAGRLDAILDIIAADTTTDIPAQITGLNDVAATDIVSAGAITTLTGSVASVDLVDVLTTYTGNTLQTADHTAGIADIPTVAEFEVRTPTAAQLAYIADNAVTGLPVTFTTSGGSTTAAVIALVDGSAGSATNDQYNGRLLVFTDGTLKGVVTDITDYVGSTTTATITAIPVAPTASHNARLI